MCSFIFRTKNKMLAKVDNLDNKKSCSRKRHPVENKKRQHMHIFLILFFITSIIRYFMRLSLQN